MNNKVVLIVIVLIAIAIPVLATHFLAPIAIAELPAYDRIMDRLSYADFLITMLLVGYVIIWNRKTMAAKDRSSR